MSQFQGNKPNSGAPIAGDAAATTSHLSAQTQSGFVSVLDWQSVSGISIDRQALALHESSMPTAPEITDWPSRFRFPHGRLHETISPIVELFPDILEGRVRILDNTVLVVTDFVRSAALVQELERQKIGVTTHFNQLLNELCLPIKQNRGYPIGFHGDSVHALFPGESGLLDARTASFAMGQAWITKFGGLIPPLRIGVAIGRIELGLLGANDDRRVEIMGSTVVDAFRAASGYGQLRCYHPMAQLYFADSMVRCVDGPFVPQPIHRHAA